MNGLTFDTALHIVELAAGIIVFGYMRSDVNWLKESFNFMRDEIGDLRNEINNLRNRR